MPFLSVSCASSSMSNMEISISGIDMAMGTEILDHEISENPAAFALIIPSAVLFIISFFRLPFIINAVAYITSAFINAIMAFGIKAIIENGMEKRIGTQFGGLFNNALIINIRYGFVIYIVCNIILLASGIVLLIIFFRKAIHESRNSDSDIAEIE